MNYEMRGEGDDMRIAIVEDEQALALELHALLQKMGNHADLYSSGEQFLFAWEEQPYDLVFLDIQMQGLNGLETARRLRKKDTHAYLVFLTNDPSFVFEGYEVDAVRYWLKPVQEDKLCQLLDQLEAPKAYLLWSIDGELRKLYEEDIYYLESDAHYVRCHYCKGIFRMKGSFQKVCAELSGDFLNCHRSYCVNLNHIHALRKDGCMLDNEECIPVSRGMKQRVQEEIMKRCKRDLLCRF